MALTPLDLTDDGWIGDELQPKSPAWAGRSFWHVKDLDAIPDTEGDANAVYDLDADERVKLQCLPVDAGDLANLVGSELHRQPDVTPGDRLHCPVLDIDYSARLVPSSTPGHFHLYLDRPIPWRRYAVVLAVLGWAGLIEPGYARAGLRRRGTFARLRPSKPDTPGQTRCERCPWIRSSDGRGRALIKPADDPALPCPGCEAWVNR